MTHNVRTIAIIVAGLLSIGLGGCALIAAGVIGAVVEHETNCIAGWDCPGGKKLTRHPHPQRPIVWRINP